MHKPNVGWLPYVVAGASFIPLLGILFGLLAIVWGILNRRRGGLRVTAVGSVGIATTVVLYAGLFYFGFYKRGGVFDDLRSKLPATLLTQLVRDIEYYKVQRGYYPKSLEELKPPPGSTSLTNVYDPTAIESEQTPRLFFYELEGDGTHYYLRSLGRDGRPFTADDILPNVPESERAHIGLRLSR